jgi:hypothetical protein
MKKSRILLTFAFFLGAGRAQAQLPIPSMTVMAGVSQYDLSGTGKTPFGAIRLNVPLLFANVEGSLGVMHPDESGGAHTYIIPEAQLQWELFPLLVKPYVGLGGGMFRAISGPGDHTSRITGSASAGVRVGLPLVGAGFRAELRVRCIGSSCGGSSAEWTAGVSL